MLLYEFGVGLVQKRCLLRSGVRHFLRSRTEKAEVQGILKSDERSLWKLNVVMF